MELLFLMAVAAILFAAIRAESEFVFALLPVLSAGAVARVISGRGAAWYLAALPGLLCAYLAGVIFGPVAGSNSVSLVGAFIGGGLTGMLIREVVAKE